MKKVKKCVFLLGLAVLCSGCTNETNRLANENKVQSVIDEQVAEEDTKQAIEENLEQQDEEDTKQETEKSLEQEDEKNTKQGTEENFRDKTTEESERTVDYDLTQMSSDMVYATVYQLVMEPNSYIGKTIRMRGTYYATWYEPTQQYYHYVIISDAMACCAQGMEFVWEDGSHKYPDEYPADQATVEVTGTFETYREEGDSNLYCRLKNASLVVIE